MIVQESKLCSHASVVKSRILIFALLALLLDWVSVCVWPLEGHTFFFLLPLVCLVHFPYFCLQPILLGSFFTIGKKVKEHIELKEGHWNGFLVL